MVRALDPVQVQGARQEHDGLKGIVARSTKSKMWPLPWRMSDSTLSCDRIRGGRRYRFPEVERDNFGQPATAVGSMTSTQCQTVEISGRTHIHGPQPPYIALPAGVNGGDGAFGRTGTVTCWR